MTRAFLTRRADRSWDDWHAEGRRRFGVLFTRWRFACPSCGVVHTPADAEAAGVADYLWGCVCPVGVGGCGYPFQAGEGRRGLAQRGHAAVADMILIEKDGRRWRVLPFAPAPGSEPGLSTGPAEAGRPGGGVA